MPRFNLSKELAGLLIIDVQDRVLATVERAAEVLETILKVVRGFQILGLPILISEQYPQGLGSTNEQLKSLLNEAYQPWKKSTFSCLDDLSFSQHLMKSDIQQWVVVGIEAHICILQTAKGLLNSGKQVVVLNDAITSRSIYDYSTAIAEMRDDGVRISSSETVLFEFVKDSKNPEFKSISQLIKSHCSCC